MVQIITREECKDISLDEIANRIREHFTYDDYKWQLENKIKIDHPKLHLIANFKIFLVELGHFRLTRRAPARPEIENDGLAEKVG